MMPEHPVNPTSRLSSSRSRIQFLARLVALGYNVSYAGYDSINSSILIKSQTLTEETLIP